MVPFLLKNCLQSYVSLEAKTCLTFFICLIEASPLLGLPHDCQACGLLSRVVLFFEKKKFLVDLHVIVAPLLSLACNGHGKSVKMGQNEVGLGRGTSARMRKSPGLVRYISS